MAPPPASPFEVPAPTLPVRGSPGTRVPVRRVFCVGKNYAKHAAELGCDPEKEPPVFFLKDRECVVACPGGDGAAPTPVRYPAATEALHHEAELVLVVGRRAPEGARIPRDAAMGYVWGWAAGLDMTRRDLQDAARREAGPWDLSKTFDSAAPVSAVVPAAEWSPRPDAEVTCDVNGARRQRGTLGEMTWDVPAILHHLSAYVTLLPGDLVFTGTPEGVSAVRPGDVVTGAVEGLPPVAVLYTEGGAA